MTRDRLLTYGEWSPTPSDTKGLNLPERQGWLVAPCMSTRDSDTVERSNWQTMLADLRILNPDETDFEIHRFGHWACGWFSIVLVKPGSEAAGYAEKTRVRLEGYPVLDEMHSSMLEAEVIE